MRWYVCLLFKNVCLSVPFLFKNFFYSVHACLCVCVHAYVCKNASKDVRNLVCKICAYVMCALARMCVWGVCVCTCNFLVNSRSWMESFFFEVESHICTISHAQATFASPGTFEKKSFFMLWRGTTHLDMVYPNKLLFFRLMSWQQPLLFKVVYNIMKN